MRYADFSKSERTKRYIIEKVAPIFNRKGFAGTSLADLTAATGLTKGSIYGNFKNKDEVAIQAFEYNAGFIVTNLVKHIRAADTQVGKLRAYPETYRKIYRTVLANGGCPVLNTSSDADDLHQALHASVVKLIAAWKNDIMRIVRRGAEIGEIEPETDPRAMAETMIALIEGGFAMAKATGEASFILTALDQIERLIDSVVRA